MKLVRILSTRDKLILRGHLNQVETLAGLHKSRSKKHLLRQTDRTDLHVQPVTQELPYLVAAPPCSAAERSNTDADVYFNLRNVLNRDFQNEEITMSK